jgi:hypothetical protein
MLFMRENIVDTTPASMKKLNDMFRGVLLVLTGNIDGGNVKENSLDSRHISEIDADKVTITNLVVGENVTMGEGAIISWGQIDVEGIPDFVTAGSMSEALANYITASGLTAELADYQTLIAFNNTIKDYVTNTSLTTVLGTNYIITGKIYAHQITAGELTGFTVKTAVAGARVELNSNDITFYSSYGLAGFITGTSYNLELESSNGGIDFKIDGGSYNVQLGIGGTFYTDMNISAPKITIESIYPGYGSSIYLGGTAYIEIGDGFVAFHQNASNYISVSSSSGVWAYSSSGSAKLA